MLTCFTSSLSICRLNSRQSLREPPGSNGLELSTRRSYHYDPPRSSSRSQVKCSPARCIPVNNFSQRFTIETFRHLNAREHRGYPPDTGGSGLECNVVERGTFTILFVKGTFHSFSRDSFFPPQPCEDPGLRA